MYEGLTYEALMKRALDRIPNAYDKREGSVIWDALAPACAELAQIYIAMDHILQITFAETAASGGFGEWLEKRCAEMGIHRQTATYAVRLGLFFRGAVSDRQPLDVPIGSRYSIELLNYVVTERIAAGQYRCVCETPGAEGNRLFGALIPVDPVNGLTYAELSDVLIPGEEAETDTHLYARYEAAVNEQPYGGNIADYKRKINGIDGVHDCKLYPCWAGGGTVRAVVIASDYGVPSEALVETVQTFIDPEPHQQGRGAAPIGHWVTVDGVRGVPLRIAARLQLRDGITIGQVADEIATVVSDYFRVLAATWADEPYLIVRISQLEARVLDAAGVMDISDMTINDEAVNLSLGADEIPALGELIINS